MNWSFALQSSSLILTLSMISVSCKTTSSPDRGSSLASVKEDSKARGGEAMSTSLDGQWQSRCIPRTKGVYAKTLLNFESPTVTLKSLYYLDATCSREATDKILSGARIDKNVLVKGTFAVHGTDKNNLTEIDLHLQNTSAYIVAQIGPQSAIFGKVCKKTEIKKGSCSKPSGQTSEQRARELDPQATYSRL